MQFMSTTSVGPLNMETIAFFTNVCKQDPEQQHAQKMMYMCW